MSEQIVGMGTFSKAAATSGVLLILAIAASSIWSSPQGDSQELPAVRLESGIAGRTLINLPDGPFVVLHYPPVQSPDAKLAQGTREVVPKEITDFRSSMKLVAYPDATTFNCVTFALADTLDLTEHDWVEPFPKDSTYFTDPTRIALSSYCELIFASDAGQIDWEHLENLDFLEDGDIVQFSKSVGSEFVTLHMGRIHKVNSKNEMFSKLGIGPIVSSSIRFGMDTFSGDHIAIYRTMRKRKA